MTTGIDLAAYFERIGYGGPTLVQPEVLATVHRLHSASIPFENLNPWLGLPVLLDDEALQHKLVHERRGGYCYEHNLLLAQVLRQIGFEVTMLAARVLWYAPPGTTRPRTHMLLRVDLAGEALVLDGGFGGMTVTAPLRLAVEGPQPTPHEPFRLLREGAEFVMQAEVGGEWRSLYRFDLQSQQRADYEMASWYLCHHPESPFRQRLMVARTRPGGRDVLAGNELTEHRLGAPSRTHVLRSASELRCALQGVFGLQVPQVPELQARLAAMAAAG